MDRDRCADVVVSTGGTGRTWTVALSGATGAPVLMLERSTEIDDVVDTPRPLSRTRYERTC